MVHKSTATVSNPNPNNKVKAEKGWKQQVHKKEDQAEFTKEENVIGLMAHFLFLSALDYMSVADSPVGKFIPFTFCYCKPIQLSCVMTQKQISPF